MTRPAGIDDMNTRNFSLDGSQRIAGRLGGYISRFDCFDRTGQVSFLRAAIADNDSFFQCKSFFFHDDIDSSTIVYYDSL